MGSRNELVGEIAKTISDYRVSAVTINSDHVEKWVGQFSADAQMPILSEMNHVLSKTYFSRKEVIRFLNMVLATDKLTKGDAGAFCKGARFLNIQGGGGSQKEMIALLDAVLKEKFSFGIDDCGNPATTYVYLDDAIFTGNRVRRDLESWIREEAPSKATLHVLTVALHRGGQYYARGYIETAAKAVNKQIDVTWWRAIELEDRRSFTTTSDVLRPTAIPDDAAVQQYVDAMQHKPHLRTPGHVGENALFSTDEGRQVLEQEFLKAGVQIRAMAPYLGGTQRPLGHMTLETLGFGSLIVTFRNCPNNAPLALWAGDPWYPLFPRTTNSETSFANFLAGLKI